MGELPPIDKSAASTHHRSRREDEPTVRFVATEALRDGGFKVLEAETGQQALTVVEQGAVFDVLFADVNMPGSPDGIELAEQVCQRPPGG